MTFFFVVVTARVKREVVVDVSGLSSWQSHEKKKSGSLTRSFQTSSEIFTDLALLGGD